MIDFEDTGNATLPYEEIVARLRTTEALVRRLVDVVESRVEVAPLSRRYTVAEALYRIGIGYVPKDIKAPTETERAGAISRTTFDQLTAAPDGVGAELRAQRGAGGIRVTEREIQRWEDARQRTSELVATGRRNQHVPMKQRRSTGKTDGATRTRRTRETTPPKILQDGATTAAP